MLLRERREERGLTIDDLARTTKISKPVLRALEASDVRHLPADIYTRGFVKAYAQEVGLDAESTADDFLRKVEPLRLRPVPVADHLPPPTSIESFVRHRTGWLVLAAVAVGLVVYAALAPRTDDPPPAEAVGTGDYSDVARAGGLLPEGAALGDPAPASAANESLRFELVPQGPCWVSIRVGGVTVFAKLLQAGDRETIDVSEEAVVRIGEPGALSYSINGQSGRSLGRAGVPVTVRITKKNFHEFLSS